MTTDNNNDCKYLNELKRPDLCELFQTEINILKSKGKVLSEKELKGLSYRLTRRHPLPLVKKLHVGKSKPKSIIATKKTIQIKQNASSEPASGSSSPALQ